MSLTSAKRVVSNHIYYEDDVNPYITNEEDFRRKLTEQAQQESDKAAAILNEVASFFTGEKKEYFTAPNQREYMYQSEHTSPDYSLGQNMKNIFNDLLSNTSTGLKSVGQSAASVVKDAVRNNGNTVIGDAISKGIDALMNLDLSSYGSSGSGANGSGSSASSNVSGFDFSGLNDVYESFFNRMKALQDENNAWNAAQAQKQMDFQERLSNTAHQREVADLKAAGLNPVLSSGGQGASTPVGAAATADNSMAAGFYELAAMAIESMSNTAEALAVGTGSRNGLLGFLNNKNVQGAIKSVGSILNVVGSFKNIFR